ncbi:MAG: hypothetical protein ACI9RU_001845 [Litorivivens sp.]|jgi:uncharacterized protein YndB with AHSA1/START domain
MNHILKASQSIQIKSTPAQVWDALTNPDKIRVYLFGTQAETDWEIGSSIGFEGEYNGQKYKDKGNVLENNENELLKYNYWSSFSGLEDKIENYFLVTYRIETESEGDVKFTWEQEGFATEDAQKHTQDGLLALLAQIKRLVEKV